jgi:hypothetical protein
MAEGHPEHGKDPSGIPFEDFPPRTVHSQEAGSSSTGGTHQNHDCMNETTRWQQTPLWTDVTQSLGWHQLTVQNLKLQEPDRLVNSCISAVLSQAKRQHQRIPRAVAFQDMFILQNDGYGQTNIYYNHTDTSNIHPISQPTQRLPLAKQA